jgi:hypothetical protein
MSKSIPLGGAGPSSRNTVGADLLFILGSALVFIVLFAIARGLLLHHNSELAAEIPS